MAKKKVINVGKIMIISGAVVILVLVALWCSSLLKISHEQKDDSSGVVTQPTMSANVIVPPVTTTTTITTAPPEMVQTTASTESSDNTTTEAVTGTLTVRGNGEFQEYIIKLANPALDIHSEPSSNSMVTSTITDRGSYIIIKETVDDDGNKWGLLEDNSGWINLADARKADTDDNTDPSDPNGNTDTDENNSPNNDRNNTQNNGNNNNFTGNSNSGLTGVDADGDGWDDGFNPDAWCPYCGYDSYYNSADGNYYCSQGHVWSY